MFRSILVPLDEAESHRQEHHEPAHNWHQADDAKQCQPFYEVLRGVLVRQAQDLDCRTPLLVEVVTFCLPVVTFCLPSSTCVVT